MQPHLAHSHPCPSTCSPPVHPPPGEASPRKGRSWTQGLDCQSSRGLWEQQRLKLGLSGPGLVNPQPGAWLGPHSTAGPGRAGSHCWSLAVSAGTPSVHRCLARRVLQGCAGGCGTSPPGTSLAGTGPDGSVDIHVRLEMAAPGP